MVVGTVGMHDHQRHTGEEFIEIRTVDDSRYSLVETSMWPMPEA